MEEGIRIVEKRREKGKQEDLEVFEPATPSSFDSRRFGSTITNLASDLSENSRTNVSGDFDLNSQRSFCGRICCVHPRDLLQFCIQCFVICPSFCIIASLVMVVSILISLFTGRVIIQEKNIVYAKFFSHYIRKHIENSELTVHGIAEMDSIKQFVCAYEDYSAEQEEVDNYLLRFVDTNSLFLHHLRVVLSNGSEISRIDLEHNDESKISQTKYDVSSKPYHKDFLSGKSRARSYSGKWTTHGPLPFGEYYNYKGDDLNGDHHPDHIEYLPLPQIIHVQKSIKCNETHYGGYVVFNIRMVVLLKEIDATNELYNVVIVNEDGDYVFFNRKREKEFQSDLGVEQTIESDWGVGSNTIRKRLFDHEGQAYDDEDVFTIGSNEFLCVELDIGEFVYHVCVIVSSFQSFNESPVPLVVGAMIDLGILGVIFCCYYNCVIRQQKRRHEKLIKNIYPKGMKSLPVFFRAGIARPVIAKYQPSLAIMFGDIFQFMEFNDSFNQDPFVIVSILSRIVDTIDIFARQFDVHKIKTMGNCYFGVIGLNFKRRNRKFFSEKKAEKQIAEDREKVKKMIKFCCLFLRYFRTRRIVVKIKNLEEEEFECPEWRVGISFGGCVAGVLSHNTPYFDIWGRPVGLASHMEGMSEPSRIHISKRVHDMVINEPHFDFTTIKETYLKGFGHMDTFFVKIRKFRSLDLIIKTLLKTVLKKHDKKFFRKKSKSEIAEVNDQYQNEIMQEIVLQLESQNRAHLDDQLRSDGHLLADGSQRKSRSISSSSSSSGGSSSGEDDNEEEEEREMCLRKEEEEELDRHVRMVMGKGEVSEDSPCSPNTEMSGCSTSSNEQYIVHQNKKPSSPNYYVSEEAEKKNKKNKSKKKKNFVVIDNPEPGTETMEAIDEDAGNVTTEHTPLNIKMISPEKLEELARKIKKIETEHANRSSSNDTMSMLSNSITTPATDCIISEIETETEEEEKEIGKKKKRKKKKFTKLKKVKKVSLSDEEETMIELNSIIRNDSLDRITQLSTPREQREQQREEGNNKPSTKEEVEEEASFQSDVKVKNDVEKPRSTMLRREMFNSISFSDVDEFTE